jgi:hypothetical protein
MNSLRYFVFIFSFILILGSIQTVYGHGLGNVESDVLFFNDSFFKVKVQTTPDVLSGNESSIGFKISTINDDQNVLVSNVKYDVKIFDGQTGHQILSFNAYSPDDSFHATIFPDSDVIFLSNSDDNDVWIGSADEPLEIHAPIFLQGGLVQVDVSILEINSKSISKNSTFETLLTIGEYIPFEVDFDDKSYDFMFATYFDRIDEFSFDQKNKKLAALMPFNWNRDFIEKIPFVHAEFYIPKSFDLFNKHEIKMTVNDISLLGTIDRSGDDEIVVHFLIPTKKLLKLYDDISEDERDRIIFGIQSGKLRDVQKNDASLEKGDKIMVLSSQEDWKFHLSLTPKGQIFSQNEIRLNLEFRDPVTNTVIPQITYSLDIFLNGQLIESKQELETPDGKDSVSVIFSDNGAAIIRIFNVNNYDTSGEFSFKVSEPQNKIIADKTVEISKGSSFPGCELDSSCYVSSVVNIIPNQTVLWKNIDSATHTVTSGSPKLGSSNDFDSGILPSNGEFSHMFSKSGIFSYYCTLHPWMIGLVDVQNPIPSWIKNNAGWWADGTIDDDAFIQAIQFLIQNNVIAIPSISQGEISDNSIPSWIKNNAGWWADGTIDDDAFIQGLQFLIKNGIIQV